MAKYLILKETNHLKHFSAECLGFMIVNDPNTILYNKKGLLVSRQNSSNIFYVKSAIQRVIFKAQHSNTV